MIGIIGAMDKEIKLLLQKMMTYSQKRIADKTFYIGELADKEVVLVKSGIGKVNATMTTAILLSHFPIDFVINTGVAGGVHRAEIGDIVIADGICYSDVSLEAIDNLPFGKMADDPMIVFPDGLLKQKALSILSNLHCHLVSGNIASGDQFVTTASSLNPINKVVTNIVAVEMEGMAIAMTCYKFNIPFLSIRGISDVIDKNDQTEVYNNISDQIAHDTATFVVSFLEES